MKMKAKHMKADFGSGAGSRKYKSFKYEQNATLPNQAWSYSGGDKNNIQALLHLVDTSAEMLVVMEMVGSTCNHNVQK